MGSPFPIAFLMGLLIIFQGLTASLIDQPGSFALLALTGGTWIVLLSQSTLTRRVQWTLCFRARVWWKLLQDNTTICQIISSVAIGKIQWFITFLEVLNTASFIHAFVEPFVVGAFFSHSKHVYITIYCISSQTSGVNQTAEPLKLTHRASGVRSNPG